MVASSGEINCTSTTVTLDGSGSSTGNNISYDWQDANGNNIGTGTTLTVSNAGTYTLIITNGQNGCVSQATETVFSNNIIPIASIAAPNELTCALGTITIDGSASSSGSNISYNWTDLNRNSLGTNNTLDVFSGGDYQLMVTDNSNGCTCLLYTSPSPRDATLSRMPSSA